MEEVFGLEVVNRLSCLNGKLSTRSHGAAINATVNAYANNVSSGRSQLQSRIVIEAKSWLPIHFQRLPGDSGTVGRETQRDRNREEDAVTSS